MEPVIPEAETAEARFPFRILLLAGALLVGSVAVLTASGGVAFKPYFGSLSPVLATTFVVVLGIAVLRRLVRTWGFRVYDHALPGRVRWAAMLWAVPFMATVTLADLALGFPPDVNQPLPMALLFYPTMGIIAQIALHLAWRAPECVAGLALIDPVVPAALTGKALRWRRSRWCGRRGDGAGSRSSAPTSAIRSPGTPSSTCSNPSRARPGSTPSDAWCSAAPW